MYRLAPTHKATRPIIMSGMLLFGFTRPIQFLWIIGSLIATWDDIIVAHAAVQIVLATLFTSLQLYSLSIHWSIYVKCGKLSESEKPPKITEDTPSETADVELGVTQRMDGSSKIVLENEQ